MTKLSIRNILVPIDFSKLSVRAIATAKHLARRFQANVHLVNVCEQFYPAGFYAAPAPVPLPAFTYLENVRQAAVQRLKTLAKEHRLTGTCHAEIGVPVFDEICRIAQEIPADIIVTSTHGRTGLKHVFLGSTAERLVQHSPCPVLVARESKTKSSTGKINRILVPVDFSECSLQGLKYAVQFADKLAAKIVVLNAVYFGYAFTADGYGIYDLSRLQDAVCKGAEEQMRKIVRRAKFGGIKFETQVKVGLPVDVIQTVAQENNIDLIITATHGRTGFKHILIGSTAEKIVRHAPCSVLVVPSHPLERAKHLSSRTKRPRQLPQPRPLRTAMKQKPREPEQFTKRFRKVKSHPFPERRKTNKFRESHSMA